MSRGTTKTGLVVLLAFLPIIGHWGYKEYVHPRPFWIHYYDPETVYYYTGRELLQGRLPHNLDQPATPVQLLGAGLMTFTGRDPNEFERFRTVAHWTALLFALTAAMVAGIKIFGDFTPMLLIPGLWTFYVAPQSLEYSNVWSPEALSFPVGVLAVVMIWRAAKTGFSRRSIFIAGFLIGIACSLKFTFLAWVPAFVMMLLVIPAANIGSRGLNAGIGFAGISVGFVAVTAVVASGYPYMFRWLFRLATHSGEYGSGDTAPPELSAVFSHWTAAILSAKGWVLWLLVCGILVAHGLLRGRVAAGDRYLLVFIAVAFSGSYLMISRHMALRYLLPTALCAVLLYRIAADQVSGRPVRWALFVLSALLLAKHLGGDLDTHRTRTAVGLETHQQVNSLIQQHSEQPDPVVLYSFRFPQRSFALRMGARDPEVLVRLSEVYPSEGHYDAWTRTIHLPNWRREWHYLVIATPDLPEFIEPLGSVLGEVNGFAVIASPQMSLRGEAESRQ